VRRGRVSLTKTHKRGSVGSYEPQSDCFGSTCLHQCRQVDVGPGDRTCLRGDLYGEPGGCQYITDLTPSGDDHYPPHPRKPHGWPKEKRLRKMRALPPGNSCQSCCRLGTCRGPRKTLYSAVAKVAVWDTSVLLPVRSYNSRLVVCRHIPMYQ